MANALLAMHGRSCSQAIAASFGRSYNGSTPTVQHHFAMLSSLRNTLSNSLPTNAQSILDQRLVGCVVEGCESNLALTLAEGANPHARDCLALLTASETNLAACVEILLSACLSHIDGSANATSLAAHNGHADCRLPDGVGSALSRAAHLGHVECLRSFLRLIPRADLFGGAVAFHALLGATRNGHSECTKLLAPLNSTPEIQRALCSAADYGRAECIMVLAPLCDPRANASAALRLAAEAGYFECVQVLLPHSDALAEDPNHPGRDAAFLARRAGRLDLSVFIQGWALSQKEALAIADEVKPSAKLGPSRRASL